MLQENNQTSSGRIQAAAVIFTYRHLPSYVPLEALLSIPVISENLKDYVIAREMRDVNVSHVHLLCIYHTRKSYSVRLVTEAAAFAVEIDGIMRYYRPSVAGIGSVTRLSHVNPRIASYGNHPSYTKAINYLLSHIVWDDFMLLSPSEKKLFYCSSPTIAQLVDNYGNLKTIEEGALNKAKSGDVAGALALLLEQQPGTVNNSLDTIYNNLCLAFNMHQANSPTSDSSIPVALQSFLPNMTDILYDIYGLLGLPLSQTSYFDYLKSNKKRVFILAPDHQFRLHFATILNTYLKKGIESITKHWSPSPPAVVVLTVRSVVELKSIEINVIGDAILIVIVDFPEISAFGDSEIWAISSSALQSITAFIANHSIILRRDAAYIFITTQPAAELKSLLSSNSVRAACSCLVLDASYLNGTII
jgi:hypothetical protein